MTEYRQPDLICTTARAIGEVVATRAIVLIEVEQSSKLRGGEAEQAAKIVGEIRAACGAAGIESRDVELLEAQLTNEQGLLLKSSSANFRLRITQRDPAALGALLGCLAQLDDVEVQGTSFRFDDEAGVVDELLATATREALGRARRVAEALEQSLGGIHRLDHQIQRGGGRPMMRLAATARSAKMSAPSSAMEGLTADRREDIEVHVQAQFHLA